MSIRPLRVLVVPAKPFPCDHPMLESVFAQGLPDRGHRVRWVMPAQPGTPPGTYSWRGSTVRVVRGSSGGVGAVTATLRSSMAVFRELRAGTDVVVVRNSVRFAFPLIMLKMFGGPAVVYQFSFPVAERRRAIGGSKPIAGLSLLLRRSVLRRSDLVLAVSQTMRRELIADGLVEAHRVMTMPLGAESSLPAASAVDAVRAELSLGSDPMILYFGAVVPERRLGFLVEVARKVRRTHPEARWVLVGPSAEGEDQRLMDAAHDLGDRFRVMGGVPRARIGAYVAAAAITVSPIPPDPLFRVASPTKTVESLAIGTPVVVTPIEDQADLVERTGGGLVASFEPDGYADAVCRLLDDATSASAMGAAARERVLSERSYDVLTERLVSALRHLTADAAPSPAKEVL